MFYVQSTVIEGSAKQNVVLISQVKFWFTALVTYFTGYDRRSFWNWKMKLNGSGRNQSVEVHPYSSLVSASAVPHRGTEIWNVKNSLYGGELLFASKSVSQTTDLNRILFKSVHRQKVRWRHSQHSTNRIRGGFVCLLAFSTGPVSHAMRKCCMHWFDRRQDLMQRFCWPTPMQFKDRCFSTFTVTVALFCKWTLKKRLRFVTGMISFFF